MNTSTIQRREEKLEALQQQLTDAVTALVTGEDWRRALTFAAQFRSRSFNNTLLIWTQHQQAYAIGRVPEPTPTYVAGFQQWASLGRHVMKGQAGYGILAPVTARFASSNPADPPSWRRLGRNEKPRPGEFARTRMIGVRPTYVWDVSQTDGEPLTQRPEPRLLVGEAPAGLWNGLRDQITAAGYRVVPVNSADQIHGANGLTNFLTHDVSVRVDMDQAAQVKTLAHELGHVLMHAPTSTDAENAAQAVMHRGVAEVEAESLALMIGAAHAMDTSSYTIPYLASWATTVPGKTPAEVIGATAEKVRRTAITVLDNLPTTPAGDGVPPGLERGHDLRRVEAPHLETSPPPAAAARFEIGMQR